MICRSDGENSGGRRSGKVVGMGCTLGTHPARYEIEAFLSRQRAHREVGLRSGIAELRLRRDMVNRESVGDKIDNYRVVGAVCSLCHRRVKHQRRRVAGRGRAILRVPVRATGTRNLPMFKPFGSSWRSRGNQCSKRQLSRWLRCLQSQAACPLLKPPTTRRRAM